MRVKEENDFRRDAILMNGVAKQIISGIASIMNDRNKFIKLKELYPELFGSGNMNTNMTAVEVWDKFLRG